MSTEDFLATAESLADMYEALTPENRILLGIGQQLRRIADALEVKPKFVFLAIDGDTDLQSLAEVLATMNGEECS